MRAPSSAPRSIAIIVLFSAYARTRASLDVKAPSRNTGSKNRLTVAIGTTMSWRLQARLNPATMRSRSDAAASIGTRSLSCRLTPHAPTSARSATASSGGRASRTTSPNGSRPRLPTVQRPKENLSSGRGANASGMVDSAAMANRLQTVPESLAAVIGAVLWVAVLLRPGQAAVQTPAGTPEQLQAGQRVFAAQCGFCHGRDAMGGETGPNLTRSTLLRDDASGDALRALLREGRTDKGMPAFRLSDADTTAISAFIRDQKTKSESPGARRTVDPDDLLSGNADRGRTYFNGTGRCATCHSPTGDLAGVATRRQGLELLQRMLYPSKSSTATVTVTPRAGEPVSGTLAYRDEFT